MLNKETERLLEEGVGWASAYAALTESLAKIAQGPKCSNWTVDQILLAVQRSRAIRTEYTRDALKPFDDIGE